MEPIPLGPFELYEPIGKGGMGVVWRGRHVHEDFPVAVKVLTREGARRAAYVEAFQNEVRAVAALDHPGIIMPLDYGEVAEGSATRSDGSLVVGSPFIVMELARRGNLKQYTKAIGWDEIKAVLFTILDALAHAHAAGVIHRDLKPANILIGCTGPKPGIKLTDFGLARVVDTLERSGNQEDGWGTPHYMAPEQFRGLWRDYGPWTDLYSLGVMAFELVAGFRPFSATSQVGFAKAHALEPPAKFHAEIPVPDGFEGWLMRLLQKSPEHRFQRAADAAWALQLLGDPSGGKSMRRTVAMIPRVEAEPTGSTAPPQEGAVPQIRNQGITGRGFDFDPDPTMVDRPDTTLLIDDFDDGGTASLNLREWAEMTEPEMAAHSFEGRLAERTPPPLPFTWKRPQTPPPSLQLLGAGLGLFGLRAIRLVGRGDERDVIWEALKAVRLSGHAHAVVLEGAAGSGKSRLADWMARRAHEVGSAEMFVATHNSIPGANDGLPRMMGRHFRTLGLTREQTRLRLRDVLTPRGFRKELDWDAFTELALPTSGTEDESQSFHFSRADQRFGLIRRYLAEVTADRPAVIVLDDVQWGSEALSFVNYLLERPDAQNVPALIVCTVRSEALVERPVEAALLGLLRDHERVQAVDLKPLPDSDTASLVRELLMLEGELAEEVERRSAGNPLFAVQLVGDWVAGGKLQFGTRGFELRPGARADVPDDIHALWMGRLERILAFREADAWTALELAAALGRDVNRDEWDLACRYAGVTLDASLSNDLLQSGLARSYEDGWTFVHGMLRETLERSAREKGTWPDLNRKCGEMLETRYPRRDFPFAERMARHLIESGQPVVAIEYLLEAARNRLALSDFDTSEDQLGDLTQILTEAGLSELDERWGRALALRAELAVEQGLYEDAQRFAEELAIDARRHGWRRLLPEAYVLEGGAQQSAGRLPQAHRNFDRARSLYDENNDLDGVARALRGLGRVEQYQGNYSAATSHLQEARDLFLHGKNSLGVARTYNALGDVARHRTDYASARAFSMQAMQIFKEVGNQIGVADCINDLAELSRLEGDLDAALNSCNSALEIYESLGSEESMFVRINLGLILLQYARYRDALETFTGLRDYFSRTGQGGHHAATTVYMLPCLSALDDWDAWWRMVEAASDLLRATDYHSADIPRALQMTHDVARGVGREDEALRIESLLEWYRDSTREFTRTR